VLEKHFGKAPLAVHFEQAAFEKESQWENEGHAAVLEALRERPGEYLVSVDGEETVRSLVDRVVRHLRVHGTQRLLRKNQEAKEKARRVNEINNAQREYLHAASHFMTHALKRSGAQTARVEGVRTEGQRKVYLEPTGVLGLKVTAREERSRQAHDQLLEYLGPHFFEDQEQQREQYLREQYLGGGGVTGSYAASGVRGGGSGGGGGHSQGGSPIGARSGRGGGVDKGGSASILPRFALTAPSNGMRLSASGVPSGPGSTLPSALLSPRYEPWPPKPRFEPRVDLQLSPRNWRERTPVGIPAISLPSVRGVYNKYPVPTTGFVRTRQSSA